jgi:hypothetical protein
MRGKLAQPKTLVFDSSGYARLGWYSLTQNHYTTVHTRARLKNALMNINLPVEFSRLTVRIRSQENQPNKGVELIYDKERLILRYTEDKFELAVKTYSQKPNIREMKILTHEEYYEIYIEGILEMTALGYRYFEGYYNLDIDGDSGDFDIYKYTSNVSH